MYLAKVVANIVSTIKLDLYHGKKLLVIRPLDLEGNLTDEARVAVDLIEAGIGDIVVASGAPGVAREVFKVDRAPIRTLIVGLVDTANVGERRLVEQGGLRPAG